MSAHSFRHPAYFSAWKAHETGNLELRTNAIARQILVDENGRAKGVASISPPLTAAELDEVQISSGAGEVEGLCEGRAVVAALLR